MGEHIMEASTKQDLLNEDLTKGQQATTTSYLRSPVANLPTMAASPETNTLPGTDHTGQERARGQRQSRYVRDPHAIVLTSFLLQLLETVAAYRLVSLPQLVRLGGQSAKAVQRAMRALFDAGLVEIVAAPRAALAGPNDPNGAALLFGSAPNIYMVTRAGIRLLDAHGLATALDPPPAYGPKNSLLLRHELGLRDFRIWLELAARRHSCHALKAWYDGMEAVIDLGRMQAPKSVRPDAWFVYRLGQREERELVLTGFVEWDRATERGERRWSEKLVAYCMLFSGSRLRGATGYENARVLVICPTASRREALADLIAGQTEPSLAQRFWLTVASALAGADLALPVWQRPGSKMLRPLTPASVSLACADGAAKNEKTKNKAAHDG